ncbi:MAG: hypothetical protein U1F11_05155 [Steroidobacteraceae bacterium]
MVYDASEAPSGTATGHAGEMASSAPADDLEFTVTGNLPVQDIALGLVPFDHARSQRCRHRPAPGRERPVRR